MYGPLKWIQDVGVVFLVVAVASTTAFNCPVDWLKFSDSCYLFRGWPPLKRDDARFFCTTHGGGLVSVTSKREHNFISRYLQAHGNEGLSWYTSGEREVDMQGTATDQWQAIGEPIREPLFWVERGVKSDKGGAIVYHSSDASYYRWDLTDPANPHGYICEVPILESYRIIQGRRNYDYGLAAKDLNDMERGPHFIKQPYDIVVVGKMPNVQLECVVSGRPLPVYSWWRGEDFKIRITSELDSRYTITNGKLIINTPIELKDSGWYRCQAENKYGRVISSGVKLSFGTLGEFSNVPDAPVNAKAYEGAAVDCSKINYKPAVKYQWYKNDPSRFIRPRYQSYIFMSQNGKLYFSEVTNADEGNYHCIAILTGTGQYSIGSSQPPMRVSLPIPLDVIDQTPIADWGPVIQNEFIAVFPKPPLKGDNVRLECFAYGSATSQFLYSWRREGQELPNNAQLLDHNRVLILRDASLDDQGVYTCVVSRGSSNTDRKSLDLVIGARPYFLTPIGDQHLDLGAQFTWRCEVRASPWASYQWYKNGKPLVTDDSKFIKVVSNVLIFTKLDPKLHDGMYQCAASNDHGITLSEGQVRVLAFAPTFIKNPLQPLLSASRNGNITISCKPDAAPMANITWYRDGSLVSEWGTKSSQRMNGDLMIYDLHETDQGKYMCKAQNMYGKAEDSTVLSIVEGIFITTAPQDSKAVINSTVFFYCMASHASNSDMVYVWRFNGFTIDPYLQPEYKIEQENAVGKTGLYIIGVQLYNTGVYECTATTPMNSDTKEAYLTVVGPPAEPAGVTAELSTVTNTSVGIRWTESSSNGLSIVSYVVEAESFFDKGVWEIVIENLPAARTVDDNKKTRSAMIENLNPGCGYRFRVTAANEVGYGPPSVPSPFVRTLSAPPLVAPFIYGGGGGSVGDLTITWQPLSRTQEGGSGIGYIVEWRRKQASSYLERKWTKTTVKSRRGKYVKLVGKDNYYLEYEARITPFNDKGEGPSTDIFTVMSAEDLPSVAPTGMEAEGYNGTAMEVWWGPVPDIREQARGKILGYQINYWYEEEQLSDYKKFIRFRGSDTDTGIVIGLWSDNFFYFTSQAYNSAGLGPLSDYVHQETLHAPPVHYPEEVRVSSAGGHRATVWWRGIMIAQPESVVRGFMIYYWPVNDDYRNALMHEVPGRDSNYATINVEEGVVYALRVSGYSYGGFGRKSLTTYFTLEGENILVDSNLIQTVEAFESDATVPKPSCLAFIVTSTLLTYFIIKVFISNQSS